MELLLDTNTLIWALFDDEKLPKKIKELISNESNSVFYSAISLWEIEIKHIKHPELMPYSFADIFAIISELTDYGFLNIQLDYLALLKNIEAESIHNDPFDHMLLATAKAEDMKLITHDKVLAMYPHFEENVIVFN